MTTKKSSESKKPAAAKKTSAKKAPAKKAPAKKAPTKKAPAKKAPAKKSPAKKAPAKKAATKSGGIKSAAKKSGGGRKYSPDASKNIEREMREMKEGKLTIGNSGKKVTNPKQAIAIGLSEARRAGKKVPPNPNDPKKK